MDLEGVSVAESLATHLASNGNLGSVELLNVQSEVSLATAGRGTKLALKDKLAHLNVLHSGLHIHMKFAWI